MAEYSHKDECLPFRDCDESLKRERKSLRFGLDTYHYRHWRKQITTNETVLNNSEYFKSLQKRFSIDKMNYSDREYTILDYDGFMAFLKADLTSWIMYKEQVFDCDNYTDVLFGNVRRMGNFPIAKIYGKCDWQDTEHAFNIFLAKKDNVVDWFVLEPQTDKVKGGLDTIESVYFIDI